LSPILVRPVREQLEHDRLIRLLHAKFRRKHEAGMNPGNEQNASVGTGAGALHPDLVLMSPERGHRLQTVVEVETGESVNHLEALAQWAHFAKTRAAFHLYVPANMVDVARRLCEDNQIHVSEIWSYHLVGDEPRFTLVHRSREPQAAPPRPKPAAAAPAKKPATHAKTATAVKAAPKARKAAKPAKPKPGKAKKKR
jgi:pyruvate/2-oxoglutarate dehydrogenase complex dihydrolipoamide acyltransferase (E2) component